MACSCLIASFGSSKGSSEYYGCSLPDMVIEGQDRRLGRPEGRSTDSAVAVT
jgi:hypothetical protein